MKKNIFNVDPYNFTTSAFLIGILLLQELSSEEQDSIGNWLQLVGLTMQTYASQYSTLNSLDSSSNDKSECNIETLKKAIKKMESELDNISKKNSI